MVKTISSVWGFAVYAAIIAATLLCAATVTPQTANAAINEQINFQGKLANLDGTNVTNGTYSLRFRIYTDPTADAGVGSCPSGTCQWEETQASVSVTDGIFRVGLGSVNTAIASQVNFNGSALYLGIKVGADSEMTPRVRLTAAPYAFNSALLNGLTSSNFVQLAQGVQTDASATNASIAINKTAGTAAILQLQKSGADVLNVSNTGAVTVKNTTNSTTAFQVQRSGSATPIFAVDTQNQQVDVVAANIPTASLLTVSNIGQPVVTADANGIDVDFVGGAAAVEAAGMRIDFTPGGTSGGTWNGLRIVANPTGAASGVESNGVKLEGPTTPGAGAEVAINIDANWDAGLQIDAKTSDPGTPGAGSIYVYARQIAGRNMLRQKGPSGVSFAYQPALFEQVVSIATPNATAEGVTSSLSNNWAVSALGAGVAPTSTEVQGYTADYPTSAAANAVSTIGQTVTQWYRGSTSGANGFFYVSRLHFPDANYGTGATGSRIWTGLTNQAIGNIMTNSDNPAGSYAGFHYSTTRGDVNWQFITKNGTTQNVVNTTMPFTVAKLYDFYVYTPPQGTTVYWRIDNLTDGTTQEGNTATNLPTNNVAHRGLVSLQTLTGTARNIRMAKIYIEADR